MKKINILPPEIFNLLAAGEVVENPASIVKEAVENSLDAGATEIEIAIEDGGFTEIRITDNGAGCDDSQIEKVFLPHATSKIASAKDLERISTLGFRGEALSSIASVSKLEFVSRTENSEMASKISLDAGKILGKSMTGANKGTELVVRNLFYNVPARRKFLGTMQKEGNNVLAVVQNFVLANPYISFKYSADGEVVYSTAGDGLASAIETIYGKSISTNLIEVNVNRGNKEYQNKDSLIEPNPTVRKLTLSGYISAPSFSKKNRTWQTCMINGRIVEGGIVSQAANDAFQNYLMVGNFPFFVLDLKIDASTVDVNVHPRKLQVKFEDEKMVYDFVRTAVSECIDKSFSTSVTEIVNIPEIAKAGKVDVIKVSSADNVLTFLEKAGKFEINKSQKEIIESKPPKFNPYYEHKRKSAEQTEIKVPVFDGKILGTFLDTYILVQSGESLYIIDQHAAHERILFDELSRQIDSGKVEIQPLLDPAVLVLTPAEMNRAMEVLPCFNEMGIECETFGRNTFRITAVPVAISTRGISTVVMNVLSETKGTAANKLSDIVREKVITECCKSAIKAGQHLSQEQVGMFISLFKGLKTPLCPHGRPVVVALDRNSIERMFKR